MPPRVGETWDLREESGSACLDLRLAPQRVGGFERGTSRAIRADATLARGVRRHLPGRTKDQRPVSHRPSSRGCAMPTRLPRLVIALVLLAVAPSAALAQWATNGYPVCTI